MDAHVFAVDILVAEMADFPDTQTRRIHEGTHGSGHKVRDCGDEGEGIFLGGHIRKICVELPERKL